MYGGDKHVELEYLEKRYTCCCGVRVKTCAVILAIYHGLSLFSLIPLAIILPFFSFIKNAWIVVIPTWLFVLYWTISVITFIYAVYKNRPGYVCLMRINYFISFLITMFFSICTIIFWIIVFIITVTQAENEQKEGNTENMKFKVLAVATFQLVVATIFCVFGIFYSYFFYNIVTKFQKYLKEKESYDTNHPHEAGYLMNYD